MSWTSEAFSVRTAAACVTVNFFFLLPEMIRQVTLRRAPSLALAVKMMLVVLVDFPEVLLAESQGCASSGISSVHSWSQENTRFPVDPSSAPRVTVLSEEKLMVAS